jgi:hypothetical protein
MRVLLLLIVAVAGATGISIPPPTATARMAPSTSRRLLAARAAHNLGLRGGQGEAEWFGGVRSLTAYMLIMFNFIRAFEHVARGISLVQLLFNPSDPGWRYMLAANTPHHGSRYLRGAVSRWRLPGADLPAASVWRGL